MQLEAALHSDNLRVTIKRREGTVWACLHEKGEPFYRRSLAIFLSTHAELAAWEDLAAALAAQDVPATEEV